MKIRALVLDFRFGHNLSVLDGGLLEITGVQRFEQGRFGLQSQATLRSRDTSTIPLD